MNFLDLLKDLSDVLKKHQNTIDAVETIVAATVPGAAPVLAAVDAVQSAASATASSAPDAESAAVSITSTVASVAAPLIDANAALTLLTAVKAVNSIAQAVADDNAGVTVHTPK